MQIFINHEEFDYVNKVSLIPIPFDDTLSLGRFAEPLLNKLGAGLVESVDASGYEGATHVVDFNAELPELLKEKYTTYLDFGSMEHIFDTKQVLKNVASALTVGGNALIVANANGHVGHGLYQFSPEFFYSAFSERNGFEKTTVILVDLEDPRSWFFVRSPREVRGRNEIPFDRKYYIVCFSSKKRNVSDVEVYQSDYSDIEWKKTNLESTALGTRYQYTKPTIPALKQAIGPYNYIRLRSIYRRAIGREKKPSKAHLIGFDPEHIRKNEFVEYSE
jgi:hypothetical protein